MNQLALRTSMRNQLPASVQRLRTMGRIVTVTLALADGTPLASRITRESAELLGLAAGLPVLALCKATAVAVVATPPGKTDSAHVNALAGTAVRVARASSGDEVAMRLAGGLQLVGFAPPDSGLRSGHAGWALLDASAVVLALA
jgi:molybdate transport system regulatory protein